MQRLIGGLFLCALLVLSACGGRGAQGKVRLATTTSTDNSGLLDAILPDFEKETGLEVQKVAVGTGQALALGRRGDADIVLVHARKQEDAFVASGEGIDRHDVMWNDFVILGPPSDPAGIRGLKDAAAAMQKIAAVKARFVSRGDNSGTHTREKQLWQAGGGKPASYADPQAYVEKGSGMGATLQTADELKAYVLSDRGTWLAYKSRLDLEILVEGDPALKNPYGIILVNPARHPEVNAEGARKLLEWFVSPRTQEKIGAFEVNGQVLFHPSASG